MNPTASATGIFFQSADMIEMRLKVVDHLGPALKFFFDLTSFNPIHDAW
jgi:hypothetical protein